MSRVPARLLTLGLAVSRSLRSRPLEDRKVRRILVAHYLLLGDTLLLAPLLAKLARRYPEAERIVLARPSVAPLFSGMPYGFKALAYDPRDFSTFRKLLAAGPFDVAYVLGDNRYAWLARAAGARWIVGFDNDHPAWKNWMLDERHPSSELPAAWADMVADLAPGGPPPPFLPGDWPTPIAQAITAPEGDYAVLHVGASSPLKFWPAERWRSLADALAARGITPIWSAGRGEESQVEAIDPQQNEPHYLRYCGTLNLPQLWHLLAGARLLVSPDTGIAHLGKLVGLPTLTLFGPGSASIHGKGHFWRNAHYTSLTDAPFSCRDQNVLFRREIEWVRRCGRAPAECPTPGACMRAISLEVVLTTANQLLDRSKEI